MSVRGKQFGGHDRVSARFSVHIAVTFAVCIVALAALLTGTTISRFQHDQKAAAGEAHASARLVADEIASEIAQMPAMLASFAKSEAFSNAASCAQIFSAFAGFPGIVASVAFADGSVLCSSSQEINAADHPYAEAPWLAQTLATNRPITTEPAKDPVTGTIAMTFALPTAAQSRPAVFVLSYDPQTLASPDGAPAATGDIMVLDSARDLVLADWTDDSAYQGRSIAGTELAEPVPASGALRAGLDGGSRVYGEAVVDEIGWHVLAGIPTDVAFATARQELRRNLVIGGLTIVLVIGLGLTLVRRVGRPLRRLTRAIEAAGVNENAEPAPVSGPAEIAKVASAFNEMLEARHRSEERSRALVRHAYDVIMVLGLDGAIRYCSPAVETLLGRSDSDVVGQRFIDLVDPEDRTRIATLFGGFSSRPGLADAMEFKMRHTSGVVRHVECVANNLFDDPAVNGIVLTARDITERKAFEQHLSHQALHDPLTGLPNRTLVLDRLTHALARAERNNTKIGVLFLDLDRFKLINDSHGHPAGDRLLQSLADRLRTAVRPSDTMARFGGDEFVAVCEDIVDEESAVVVAERLTETLREPFTWKGQDLFLSGSVGIAISGDGETAEDLLRNADAAMYRAKEHGRARTAVFDRAMRAQALSRLQTESALHRAIGNEEFVLHYQPKISMSDGRIVGLEALIRWHDPQRGLVAPADFIAVAEETGLIVPIGEWVLTEAIRQLARWPRPSDITMAVNISPRQLAQPDLHEVVDRALAETGIDPARLTLEITEGMLVVDAEGAGTVLSELRALGVGISIDDFGTGHSSLGYLQQFPINELKIDRSFVAGLGQDGPGNAIIGSIVGLAHAIGLSVVAEGVETAAQLSELRRLGCDSAQGYYFAPPRTADDIAELLSEDGRWGTPPAADDAAVPPARRADRKARTPQASTA